jgi:uncharacterized protein (DUF1697 family)
MTRYVSFLRGINVGGHRVAMADLRRHYEDLKLTSVSTFINSGNVIFEAKTVDAAALERRIERHLDAALGYAVPTFIRTMVEVEAIARLEPFPARDVQQPGHSVIVYFLTAPLGPEAQRIFDALRTKRDEFRVKGREVYWLSKGSILETLVRDPELRRALGSSPVTTRNLNTVRKIAAKFGGSSS